MQDKLKELYRIWLLEQPLYEVETTEAHAAKFAEWVVENHLVGHFELSMEACA